MTEKKVLAQQIKADLAKDLEETKKEGTIRLTYVARPWGGCGVPCGEEGYIVLVSPTAPENKGKRDLIAPNELEKEDYEEILSLMETIRTTATKVSEQKKQAEEAELDQKLQSEKNMFFYDGEVDWGDYSDHHRFFGWQNNQRFNLLLKENHPSIANLSRWKSEGGIFCLIEGSENVPFEQKSSGSLPCKLVKSSDKITITPVDNSPYIKRLQGQKSYSEKYLEKTQKESPDKVEEIATNKKHIKEYEEKIQEEKKWLTEHDNKLPTPSKKRNKPTDKLTNLLLGELNNKNLLQYFQNNNVKSIKLDNNNLVIEYNDKQAKETKALNNQEWEWIKSLIEKLGKSELSLSDLEQNNNSINTPNSNKGIYIGLAVAGMIAVGIIAFLLVRKNKTKKH